MKPLCLLGLFLLFFAPMAFATVVHVPADQPTIQSGIDAASPGDTVLVAPGTYHENLALPAFDIVLSGSGMDSTTLKPADINLPLLIIANGSTNATIVRGISFEESGNASAIVIEISSPTICHNRFYQCSLLGAPAVLSADTASAARIHHNLFEHNDGTWQVNYQIRADGPSHIYNNTIYSARYIGVFVNHDSAIVVNNIIIDCPHRGIYTTSAALIDYNLVLYDVYYNLPYGPHGYLFDPMFVDSAAGDFHLWISSPAIDAGHPDYTDPDGTPADLGAFSVTGQPPAAWDIAFDSGALVPTIAWQYADTSATSSQTGYEIEIGLDRDWTTAELWASGEVTSGATLSTYGGAPLSDRGLYYYRLRLQNTTGWGSWREGIFAVQVLPYQTINIPADLLTIQEAIFAAADGDTISVVPGTYTGNFNRDLNFYGKQIILYAPAGPDSTTLDLGGTAEQQRHAVTFRNEEGPAAEINGFTITNGHGYISTYYHSPMVRIENAGPTFRNCRIVDNMGSAIGLSEIDAPGDTLRLINCHLSRNSGNGIYGHTGAGVIRADSSWFLDNGMNGIESSWQTVLQLDRSCFAHNARHGVFAWHEMGDYGLYVTSCTFVGNATGLWYDWSFPKNTAPTTTLQDSILTQIHNNVFAFNTEFGLYGTAPFSSYSVNCNNWFGNGTADAWISSYGPIDSANNYSLDPLFCDTAADNYTIAGGSICLPENNACGTLIGAFDVGCGDCCARMGDFQRDGLVRISDVTAFIGYLFRTSPPPTCFTEADVNPDSQIDVSDLTAFIAVMFRGLDPPVCPAAP